MTDSGKHKDDPGYKEKFLKLIQQNRKIIFKICNSYCQNKNDREDLAQDIVYQLWRSYENFDNKNIFSAEFSTWMYRVALNTAISFYRKEKKSINTEPLEFHLFEIAAEKDAPDGSNGIDGIDEMSENFRLLQRFINELKELDRALMILYLEEKSYLEIGKILGITETNVATKISRIKEKIKQKFTNYSKIN